MFKHKNAYPVILVPGFTAYNTSTKIAKYLPAIGTTAGNAENIIKDMGLECYTAEFGFLSSVWDRTCELYAQIVGGTVDYGEAHSRKFGHARYGKTYEKPLIPDWGTLTPEGQIKKITLIAFGFGAPVARLLVTLLNNGSDEEKSYTNDAQLSGLFRGGYKNLVHCVTTVAGVNEGISAFQVLESKISKFQEYYVKLGIALEYLKIRSVLKNKSVYDLDAFSLTQHGFTFDLVGANEKNIPFLTYKFNDEQIKKYLDRRWDNVIAACGVNEMTKLNNRLISAENTYYLSIAGSVTKTFFNRVTIPTLKAGILFPISLLIGFYENYYEDKDIVSAKMHENDGFMNTEASLPPVNEAATLYKSPSRCNPGVWYQFPVEKKNALSFLGFLQRPDKYRNQIYDLVKIISNLETI